MIKKINNKISVINIRGNIDTRMNKINENNLDGIILAAAGVKSLKLDKKISFTFNCEDILPAVGQGIIAVQCRKEDEIKNLIKRINDNTTNLCAIAERKMLQTIGGDCDTAIGGLAEIENHNLKLKAQLFSDSGQESFEYELTGREVDASFIGKSVGEKLLNLAGEKFKKNEFTFFLIYRFVGGIPFFISNILPTLFNVRIKNFFLGSVIGMTPQLFVGASLGAGLNKVIENNQELPSIFDIILTPDIYVPVIGMIILVITGFIIKKKLLQMTGALTQN